MSSDERFAKLAASLKKNPEVTLGTTRKGFGSGALCVGGKIFAMVTSRGKFVVKLPGARVAALIGRGVGSEFEPAPGRVMKEWMVVEFGSPEDWHLLATEAFEFVRDGKPRGRHRRQSS